MKKIRLLILILFFLGLCTSSNMVRATTEVTDGLIASYLFNGNASDSSGHGHNGVVHGSTLVLDHFGNVDSAYTFAGNAYIEIPHSDQFDLDVQDEMSISVWVKPSDTKGLETCNGSGMETIFASTNGKEGSCWDSGIGGSTPPDYKLVGFWFGFREGKLQFYLRNNGEDFTNWVSADEIPAPAVGSWSHIVIAISTIFDASSRVAGENFGRVWIYVNGIKQTLPGEDYTDVLGQPTAIIPFPTSYIHNKSLYIGGRYYDRRPCFSPCVLNYTNRQEGVAEFFSGAIDDLKIYNRVLSAAEVSQLKNESDKSGGGEPNNNYQEGAYNYYLPYFKSGEGFWSGFGISNSSDQESPYAAFVYNKAGEMVKAEYPTPLPANGQASMAIYPEQNTTGWLRINSHQPLTGLSFFAKNLMADIPFVKQLSKKLIIPHIAQNDIWDTELMICNPNDTPVEISLRCFDKAGNQVAFGGFTLPEHCSEVYPFATFGNDLTGKVMVEVTRGDGVAAFAIYTNQKGGGSYFAGINAVDISQDDHSTPF